MSLSGRDGAGREGGHRIKNRCDLTEDYVEKTAERERTRGDGLLHSNTTPSAGVSQLTSEPLHT